MCVCMQGALAVALTGVGIASVDAALHESALPQATAFHSKSVVNDMTLANIVGRCAGAAYCVSVLGTKLTI